MWSTDTSCRLKRSIKKILSSHIREYPYAAFSERKETDVLTHAKCSSYDIQSHSYHQYISNVHVVTINKYLHAWLKLVSIQMHTYLKYEIEDPREVIILRRVNNLFSIFI